MTPAEEGVIRYALQRGYLHPTQLAQAQQEQAARRARGQPAELLPLLAAFLSPQQLAELRRVYLSFSSAQVRSEQTSGSTWPTHANLQGSSELIQVTNLPDGGEQTIQLDAPATGGITYHAPPGARASGSFGPPGSVHLPPMGGGQLGNTVQASVPGQPGQPGYPAHGSSAGYVQPVGNTQGGGAGGAARLPEAGEVIGEYVLVRELARGGMGVVYDARHQTLDRRAALKVLLAQNVAEDDIAVKRFMVEAKELGRLSHPNIAAVYGAGRDMGGRHFMAMEFLEGEDLKDRIVRTGPLDPSLAAELTLKLARALEHAHGFGVLHRDMKPSNVIVTPEGEPKLVDFGLARNQESAEEALTKTGEIMGTPAYMPPEQAGGERRKVGPPADVYSLGATLYHMLTGRAPFGGTSVMNVINKVVSEDPKPPSTIREGIPGPLEAICLKCLEKELVDRYASASELAADLEAFLGPRGEVGAKQRGAFGRLVRWAQRKGAVLVGSTFALLGVGVTLAAVFAPGPGLGPTPTPTPEASVATPSPSAKVDPRTIVTSLVIDPSTLVDLKGLQVRSVWGLRLDSGGIRLPSSFGMGPELSLPFEFRRDELKIHVRAKVLYLTRGSSFRLEIVQPREIDPNGRPGGPASLRVEFGAKENEKFIEHGFRVNWLGSKGTTLRREDDAEEFAFKEIAEAGPFQLDFTLEIGRGEVALIYGKRRQVFRGPSIQKGRAYRLDLRPGPNRYEVGQNTEDQSQPLKGPLDGAVVMNPLGRVRMDAPGMACVVLEQVELAVPGPESVAPQGERHEWAQIGEIEREVAGGEGFPALISRAQRYAVPTGERGVQSNSRVRNEAVYLMAFLRAMSGDTKASANGWNGLYGANSVHPKDRPLKFQDWTAVLPPAAATCFAEGYVSYFMGGVQDLVREGTKAHVDPYGGQKGLPPPTKRKNLPAMINAYLAAGARGAKVDPVLLGSAWLYAGDPVRADAILAPLAEEGLVDALGYAGMSAYILRDYARAAGYWRLLEERQAGTLKGAYAEAFERAQRLGGAK